jgi:two-component system response regulator HydG
MSIPRTLRKPQGALLISPAADDHEIFGDLFRRRGWILGHASSFYSASAMLREKPAAVVITERDLSGGNWKDVLESMRALPAPPLLIVISPSADDRLWAEALNLGAYDVLAKPLDDNEIVRVLSLALNHRQETPATLEPVPSH